MILKLRVITGASSEQLEWQEDGILRVRLTSRPVEGKANQELIKLSSKRLKLPNSAIAIESGSRSRDKLLNIAYELDERELIRRLTG